MTINELSELRGITRILVTGGAGSVGLEVLKELHQHKKWYEVKVQEGRKITGNSSGSSMLNYRAERVFAA